MNSKLEVIDRTTQFLKVFKEGTEDNILAAIMVWHGGVQSTLSGARSGRVYRVPGTKRKYTASSPGQAPARVFGDLARSYKYQVINGIGEVGSGMDKALWLEKGTTKMLPRPHLQPAYNKNSKAIKAELIRPIKGMS